jgi:hypothetical protein
VAAPGQTLEALVRDELRAPVAELVRRLIPELVAEQLYAGGPQLPQEATNGSTATAVPLPIVKRCTRCDETKTLDQFAKGRAQCRRCRADYEKRRQRERRERQAPEDDEPAGLPD